MKGNKASISDAAGRGAIPTMGSSALLWFIVSVLTAAIAIAIIRGQAAAVLVGGGVVVVVALIALGHTKVVENIVAKAVEAHSNPKK